MAYTPPPGIAANFVALGYYEPSKTSHAFKFPAGAYTAPAGNAVAFVRQDYVYPAGNAVSFAVPPAENVTGNGAATIEITAEGHGEFQTVAVDGDGSATIDFSAEGHGAHGVAGAGAAAIDFSAAGAGAHGVAGSGEASISMTAAGVGVVERYELRGEVRLQGVLVNRRVRAYRRDTGALLGEADTVAGKFAIHAGFAPLECYLVPIDMANDATDWAPPCANRVESVLAQDAA